MADGRDTAPSKDTKKETETKGPIEEHSIVPFGTSYPMVVVWIFFDECHRLVHFFLCPGQFDIWGLILYTLRQVLQ